MFDWRVAVAYSSIGPYQITRPLGQGGMGAVYEAISPDQGHRVAIKVLHARHTHSTEAVARFFNEAKAVNLIGHEGLVKITEHGHLPDGSAYLVMEYLAGDNLAIHLHRRGRMSERDVLRVAGQLASVLAATHAAGIVHRDLKPGNVMLVPDNSVADGERVKLLDFGIAKLSLPTGSGAAPMTHVGAMLGTPQYMSPEQCRGIGKTTEKSDIYSLGAMLYQMLSGQPPFVGSGAGDLIAMHIMEKPRPLRELAANVSPEIETLVHQMLEKKPDERPSMRQVLQGLEQLGLSSTASGVGTAVVIVPPPQAAPAKPEPIPAPEPKSRLPLVLGAGGGALAIVIALLGLLRGPAKAPTEVPPVVKAVEPAPVNRVTLSVETEPKGAQVLRLPMMEPAGITPYQINHLKTDGKLELLVRLPGYHEQKVGFAGDRDDKRSIKLEPAPPPPPLAGSAVTPSEIAKKNAPLVKKPIVAVKPLVKPQVKPAKKDDDLVVPVVR